VTFGTFQTFGLVMRNVLLAGLVIVAAACGGYQFPGASPSPNIGVVGGRVMSVPCAPVEQVGSPCAGRPVGGLGIVYTSGDTVRSVVTDPQGNYAIELPPGTWKVTLKTYMRIISGPTSITVAAGSNLVADYILDNGIRAPVPQQ